MKKLLVVLVLVLALCLTLAGCGQKPIDFTGITFSDVTVNYDGKAHTIEAQGVPSGATVTYTNAGPHTQTGEYTIGVKVSAEGYNDYTATAKLTIVGIDFVGITFESVTTDYDGQTHTITAVGVPSDATVTYTNAGPYKLPGEYTIGVKVTANGYNDYTATATLKINALNFTGITFEDLALDFDGNPHTITVVGAPSFATVIYSNAGPFVDAGEYSVGVTVSAEGYNNYTTTAKLTINKIDFTDLSFDNVTVEYDGNPHSIAVIGNLPASANVSYTCDVEGVTNKATNPGQYTVTATVTGKNYNTLTLQAVLTIATTAEERFMVVSNNKLYFQNAMDDDELYFCNLSTGEIVKVSSDNAVDMSACGDGIIYVNSTALISAIKQTSYDGTKNSTNTLYTKTGVRYVQQSGDYVYCVVNGLTNEKSGIYKIDCSSSEQVVTRLSVGKAKYLTLVGDTLYFADGNNSNKLSKISTSGEDQTRQLVVDEKIHNLIHVDGQLVYTVNGLLDDYIEKYTISNGTRRQLTSDAGQSLTVIGDKLYYVNVDLFSTNFIGLVGICSVSMSPSVANKNPGTVVVPGGTAGVCSLTTDGSNLYYYDVQDYSLFKYNISSEKRTNLLEGFVAPEDPAPVLSDSKLVEYNGSIYYLNMLDGRRLYRYNPQNKSNVCITTDKVVDFAITNDTLYVNMVTYLVDNAVFMANLKTGEAFVQISKKAGSDFCSDGTYLYYIRSNKVVKYDVATDTETVLFDDGNIKELQLIGSKLYFIQEKTLRKNNSFYTIDITVANPTAEKLLVNGDVAGADTYATDGTYLYYREFYSTKSQLSCCKLDGSEYRAMMSTTNDPVDIYCSGNYVYYYNETNTTANNGLYRISKTGSTAEMLLSKDVKYAMNFIVVGNDVYFVDYNRSASSAMGYLAYGDGHFYKLSIGSTTPERLD